MKDLKELKIVDKNLILDGKKIENVISYKIEKNSAESPTELSITLLIRDLEMPSDT